MVSPTRVVPGVPVTTIERDALPPVTDGTSIYNPTTQAIEYTTDGGTTWVQVANNGGGMEAFGETFFQGNATETVISVQSTPVKVNGTYSSGDLSDFTQSLGTITYTGAESGSFLILSSLTASMNLISANITVLLVRNGSVIILKSGQTPSMDGANPSFKPISTQCLVNLNENDTLEVFIQNDTGTDNITVQDLNLLAIKIGSSTAAAGGIVTAWDGLSDPVAITSGTGMDITLGVISTTAEQNVVALWDASATPVNVTAGANMSITSGAIATTADPNIVTDWDAGGIPVAVTSGANMSITSGVVALDTALTGLTGLTQDSGNTIFNDSQAAGTLTVKTQNVADSLVIDYASDTITANTDLIVSANAAGDSVLKLDTAPTSTVGSCMIFTGIAGGTIAVTDTITVDEVTDFRFITTPPSGAEPPIVGIAVTAATVGQPFNFCTYGVTTAQLEPGTLCARSDYLRRSNTTAGAVEVSGDGSRKFAVALESAVAGATVRCMLTVSQA